MIRFTKKIRHYCDTNIDNEYTFADEDVSIGEIVDKLGPLEDDEEKLGCPLEIITGIMLKRISEIYVNYGDGGGYNSPYGDICKARVDVPLFIDIIKTVDRKYACLRYNQETLTEQLTQEEFDSVNMVVRNE